MLALSHIFTFTLFHKSQHPTYFIVKKSDRYFVHTHALQQNFTLNIQHNIYIHTHTLSYPYSDNIIFRRYILIQVFPTIIHCIHTKVFRGADINLFSLTPFSSSLQRSPFPYIFFHKPEHQINGGHNHKLQLVCVCNSEHDLPHCHVLPVIL
jgi:hypothetical protein